MLDALKSEANKTYTENGAVTNRSTHSDCLDWFAAAGALRNAPAEEIVGRFLRAYTEDPDLAMKTLFFARDVRGGLGERRIFRIVTAYLAKARPDGVRRNIGYFAEYGRWDDLLALMDTPCEQDALSLISRQLSADTAALADGGNVSLLAKWLPSVNTSNTESVALAKRIARALHMSDADYRKILSSLRAKIRIIENSLREKDYTFDYEKQPSKAMYKYRAAFLRNDGERYRGYLDRVQQGEAKLHTQTLAPYELVEPYVRWGSKSLENLTAEEKFALDTTWVSLPNYGSGENALAVIDTSGSMYCSGSPLPASVALSLGLYFAEHSKGLFAGHFIEFSAEPQLIEIKGNGFCEKLAYLKTFDQIANTDLEAVFDLILSAAVRHGVPQEELPAALYLISDMEFDRCVNCASETVFENAKHKFEAAGYKLPKIVFWNVQSRNRQQPVTKDEKGTVLVSGCTPKLFELVASGAADPYAFMMETLNSERYRPIAA